MLLKTLENSFNILLQIAFIRASNLMMTSCLKILVVFVSFIQSLLCSESCCVSKEVGGHTYHLVEDHNKVIPDACKDKCAYKKHGEEDKYYCFGTGSLPTKCLQKNECNGVIPIPEGV